MTKEQIQKQIDFIGERLQTGDITSDKFYLAEAVLCDLIDRLEAMATDQIF